MKRLDWKVSWVPFSSDGSESELGNWSGWMAEAAWPLFGEKEERRMSHWMVSRMGMYRLQLNVPLEMAITREL